MRRLAVAALAVLPFLSSRVSAEDGLPDLFCSSEGDKSVACGGQAKKGRAELCCPGLICGGEKDKYCVPPPRTCGLKGERAIKCGSDKKGAPETCCPGFKCERGKKNVRCEVDRDYDGLLSELDTFPPATQAPSLRPTTASPTAMPTIPKEKEAMTYDVFQMILKVAPTANYLNELTEFPSTAPSTTPSFAPSSRPSVNPTSVPTHVPTFFPTSTPTETRSEECKLEMYYERKWCWHDDAANSNCKTQYKYCIKKNGDSLEMQQCGQGTKWVVRGFTVRPEKDKNYCWTRRGDSGIRLSRCKEEGERGWKAQQFRNACMNNPNEITPKDDKKWCLTQNHEPRKGEGLKFQDCDKVRNSNTNLWLEED